MANKIIISRDALPTLEVLGKEYPYDTTDAATVKRLEQIADALPSDVAGMVDQCKEFITTLFCGNREPAEKIAAVYGQSGQLWLDCLMQFIPYIRNQLVIAKISHLDELKAQADGAAKVEPVPQKAEKGGFWRRRK